MFGRAADGDEQRTEFFAVAGAVLQRRQGAFQRAVLVLDLLPDPIVDRLDVLPRLLLVGADLLGQLPDLRVAALDFRARRQVEANLYGSFSASGIE